MNKEYDTNLVWIYPLVNGKKLLIAKIMFRNKEILIFDEPTSALDPLAEQEFINTLLSWYKNKTVVIISHRMTFASIADRVFVIKDGAVAEQWTPKQLHNAKGLFTSILTHKEVCIFRNKFFFMGGTENVECRRNKVVIATVIYKETDQSIIPCINDISLCDMK